MIKDEINKIIDDFEEDINEAIQNMENWQDEQEAMKFDAIQMLINYACVDEQPHKDWYLDQCLRLLSGDGYQKIINDHILCGCEWGIGFEPKEEK